MNYFRIRVDDNTQGGYTYGGASPDSAEVLAEKIAKGETIRLDNLFYMEKGKVKEWEAWDSLAMPTIFINGSKVIGLQQYKDDPRTLPYE